MFPVAFSKRGFWGGRQIFRWPKSESTCPKGGFDRIPGKTDIIAVVNCPRKMDLPQQAQCSRACCVDKNWQAAKFKTNRNEAEMFGCAGCPGSVSPESDRRNG